MAPKVRRNDSKKSQSELFKEAARRVGADEDEGAFEAKLKKIAKAKPKESAPKGR